MSINLRKPILNHIKESPGDFPICHKALKSSPSSSKAPVSHEDRIPFGQVVYHLMHPACSSVVLQTSRKCNAYQKTFPSTYETLLPKTNSKVEFKKFSATDVASKVKTFNIETRIALGKQLREAVYSQDLPRVKILIAKGAYLDLQDRYGNTLLMHSARRGYTEISQALIRAAANVNLQTRNDQTALIYATEHGHTKIVKALVTAWANTNLTTSDQKTALIYAAQFNHSEIANTLISFRARINQQDIRGRTALMYAAQNGFVNIVKNLLLHEANIYLTDLHGQTAYSLAKTEEIKTLLSMTALRHSEFYSHQGVSGVTPAVILKLVFEYMSEKPKRGRGL